eukprot:4286569-Amphidinium_carterae.2
MDNFGRFDAVLRLRYIRRSPHTTQEKTLVQLPGFQMLGAHCSSFPLLIVGSALSGFEPMRELHGVGVIFMHGLQSCYNLCQASKHLYSAHLPEKNAVIVGTIRMQ